MSWWSYINGSIMVEPFGRTQAEKRYILDTVLNHLPRVTGSEGDMEIYVNQMYGSNESSSCDEYGDRTNNLIDRYGGKSFHGGWLEIQRCYLITLRGALRDRTFEETYKEFIKWLCRLSKRMCVSDILVRINDYYKATVINEGYDSRFNDMYEWPSWCKESKGEPAWWEHLMWNRMKDCEYPMLLGYKYFNDPDNDAEVERRREFYEHKDA